MPILHSETSWTRNDAYFTLGDTKTAYSQFYQASKRGDVLVYFVVISPTEDDFGPSKHWLLLGKEPSFDEEASKKLDSFLATSS